MGLSFFQQLKYKIITPRVAVYTAIIGDKNNQLLKPLEVSKDCDYYCFTDREQPDYGIFKIIRVDPLFKNDTNRSAKHYKFFPHKYLPNYNTSIWFDGTIELKSADLRQISLNLLKNHDLAVFRHSDGTTAREDIYEEAKVCIERKLDDVNKINAWIDRIKKEGYPEKSGLIAGSFIVRRHSSEQVQRFSEMWWDIVMNYSRRDQLSFNYVAWKSGIPFKYIDEYGPFTDNEIFNWRAELKVAIELGF